MRIVLVVLLFSLLFFCGKTQDLMEWSERKLQFSDFKAQPIESPFFGELAYENKLDTVKYFNEACNCKQIEYVVKNYMNRDLSWVISSADSIQLIYFQSLFDINRKYAVLYRDSLNVGSQTNSGVKSMFDKLMNEIQKEIHQFKIDTKYGTDNQAIVAWYERQKEEIENLVWNDFGYEYGDDYMFLDFGITTMNYTENQFSSPIGFAMNIGGTYNRFQLNFIITGALIKSELPYSTEDFDFQPTDKVSNQNAFICLGYDVLSKDRFILTPYLGAAFTGFSQNWGFQQSEIGTNKASFATGANALYFFKMGLRGISSSMDFYLRGTVMYNSVRNVQAVNFGQITTTLAIGYVLRSGHLVGYSNE